MKQPFRYFRGEFANGKYLYSLVVCPNLVVKDILDELVYQTAVQWKLEDEVAIGELVIRDDDIINIAKIAGLFQPRVTLRVPLGAVQMTQSRTFNNKERSERGLFSMDTDSFKFVRVQQDDYDDDIVSEASSDLRIGFVPEGTTPIGYVPYNCKLYTDEGEIIRENLLPVPPVDGTPYVAYYGDKFLVHEELFNAEVFIDIMVFKLLFECLQRIRYNGPTIAEFLNVTKLIGNGYIGNIEIEPRGRYYRVYYQLDDSTALDNKDRLFAAWANICNQKFKLFALENRA
jgi:hypothetical protein